MIKDHPAIFPNFYAIPTVMLDRRYVKEVMDFVTYLATWFRWLPVALLQDSGDLLKVFERWQRWRLERKPGDSDEDTGWTPYYSHRRFHSEFLEFVRTCYLAEMATAREAIAAVAQTECAPARDGRKPIINEVDRLEDSSVPYRLDALFVVDVEVDYKELIESLRNKRDLNLVPARDTTVVFSTTSEQLDVWQLPPLSVTLLRLCDGRRTVKEITREFSLVGTDLDGIPIDKVCCFGLMQLREDGLIGLSASPLTWEDEKREDEDAITRAPRYSLPPQANNTQQPWPKA